jgi:hypothetical protein
MTDRLAQVPVAVRWPPIQQCADLGAAHRIHTIDPDALSGAQP